MYLPAQFEICCFYSRIVTQNKLLNNSCAFPYPPRRRTLQLNNPYCFTFSTFPSSYLLPSQSVLRHSTFNVTSSIHAWINLLLLPLRTAYVFHRPQCAWAAPKKPWEHRAPQIIRSFKWRQHYGDLRQTNYIGEVMMSPSINKHLPELILTQLSVTLASVNILCLVFLVSSFCYIRASHHFNFI